MRCLTLATALAEQGTNVTFTCRDHAGNLIEHIQQVGFSVHVLPALSNIELPKQSDNIFRPLAHSHWLGCSQQQDAQDCKPILEKLKPDWLIVDHYALDKTWQHALKTYYKKLLVIDDLADREHIADILLDQNYGSTTEKYQGLVPGHCKTLAGTHFSLLRPEFALWRSHSLKRRQAPSSITHILVNLGGVDVHNYTGKILHQLAKIPFAPQITITVIMGPTAPHLAAVSQQAADMAITTHVKSNVSNMAEIMAGSDLAIGAAGATTWERCCLGLPTIQMVIADNQQFAATALAAIGAAPSVTVADMSATLPKLIQRMINEPRFSQHTSLQTRRLVDGNGTQRVVDALLRKVIAPPTMSKSL